MFRAGMNQQSEVHHEQVARVSMLSLFNMPQKQPFRISWEPWGNMQYCNVEIRDNEVCHVNGGQEIPVDEGASYYPEQKNIQDCLRAVLRVGEGKSATVVVRPVACKQDSPLESVAATQQAARKHIE